MDVSYMSKEQADYILSKKGCDLMVITAKGKGVEFADDYSIRTFKTYDEAEAYIKAVNNPKGEKWTVAEIITEGQSFYAFGGEIYY